MIGVMHSPLVCRALTLTMLLLFTGAVSAQESKEKKEEEDPGKTLILEAYELTKKPPRSADDYTEIIDRIQAGLKQLKSEKFGAYGKTLAAWAHFKRGELYTQANPPDDEKSLADFDAAVKLQDEGAPDKPDWNYIHNRGVSYAIAGEYKKALSDFNRVIKLRPTFGKEYFNRGEIYSAQGDYRTAIGDYNQATRNGYNESVVFTRRGFAFFKLGDLQTAISQYGQAISRNNQDYEAYTYRGDARAANGQFADAVRDYQQAITINSNYPRAYYSAAWLRATCPESRYRDAQLALRSARTAVKLGGETYRNLDALAAAHARAGEYKEAAAAQQKAIQAAPEGEVERLKERLALYNDGKPYISLEGGAKKQNKSEGSSSR